VGGASWAVVPPVREDAVSEEGWAELPGLYSHQRGRMLLVRRDGWSFLGSVG